jgi:single-strand DNA-binding protein
VSDPDDRTAGDRTICKFTVAVNRPMAGGNERTAFFPVTVFGNQADNCLKYLNKGREVSVVARFETGSYTDDKGIKRKGFGFVANEVNFISSSSKSEESDNAKAKDTMKKIEAMIRGG